MQLQRTSPNHKQTGASPSLLQKAIVHFRKPWVSLILLMLGFVALQCTLPLGSAVKIGADEDFELSKATLCKYGYKLYTEIWNDQPPFVTFMIEKTIEHVSTSVLAPRLLTVAFSILFLCSTFLLMNRLNGLRTAVIGTLMLICSPGFLELSCSCMQELLALAPVVAALCLLFLSSRNKWYIADLFSGIIFGFALQMKLIGLLYLPVFALLQFWRERDAGFHWGRLARSFAGFIAVAILTFCALNAATGCSLMIQAKQSWAAHFSNATNFDYGSPQDRPFDWSLLAKNWDCTLPALIGAILLTRRSPKHPRFLLPVILLGLTFLVFARHRPWWAYYYVHNSLALSWCGAAGIAFLWESWTSRSRSWKAWIPVIAACGLLASWSTVRLCIQADAIRSSQRLHTSLVLQEIQKYRPFTKFLFTDQPVYSFHAQIPMPPHLAVVSLKRLWSGDITTSGIVRELETETPGLILLAPGTHDVPFKDLLTREYKRVYSDGSALLFAHTNIAKKPYL